MQTEEILKECEEKISFYYNEIISNNLDKNYIENFYMILGYTYRLENISLRIYHTFSEAIIAIDLERLMKNSEGIKLNSIVYVLVLKNIFDEYVENKIDEKLKEKAILTYKNIEEQKAKENKKYHMYQY